MVGCPFGFHASPDDECDVEETDNDAKKSVPQAKSSGCPFGASKRDGDDRFDYNKDPVAWFYQNQIRSEEEFQAKKEQLRQHARTKLDEVFEKKGKHLIVDSDEDDFSICSSELSAWDSEVHSIQTLASCANSWAEAANFIAPAMVTLRVTLMCTLIAAAYSGWQSLQAMLAINRFLGIIVLGWMPAASLAAAVVAVAAAGTYWYMTDSKSKKGLLGAQIAIHLLVAACSLLAMLCWVYPSRVDSEFSTSVCKPAGNNTNRLCRYLPMIQEQVGLGMRNIMAGNSLIALLGLACVITGSWHMWELAYVEKKATKHKRRRRHRKHAIPWDKIKVENMGPVSYCGGAPPRAPTGVAQGAAASEGKKVV